MIHESGRFSKSRRKVYEASVEGEKMFLSSNPEGDSYLIKDISRSPLPKPDPESRGTSRWYAENTFGPSSSPPPAGQEN